MRTDLRDSEGFWVLYPYREGEEIYLASVDFRRAIEAFYEEMTGIFENPPVQKEE